MQKEEQLIQKRFSELSNIAFHRNIVTYTDFLNLNELNILHTLPKDLLFTKYQSFGGYDLAERQMVAFLPDALYYEINFPYQVCKISALNAKYSETLTHRDYLGAILNLGIDRSRIGDILVMENETILFVQSSMVDFICSELTRIRHTAVLAATIPATDFHYEPKVEEITGTVASVRLDSLLSLAFSSSRSKLVGLIEGGKVFVNGRLITTNSYQMKENDIVSVRGMGKFQYVTTLSTTKKNRALIQLHKYI